MKIFFCLFLFVGSLQGQEPGAALTLKEAVQEALEKSPEVAQVRRQWEEAALEEPLLLSVLDPKLQLSYSYIDDQTPRAAPVFEGVRSQTERSEAGIVKNTLLGTEAKLLFFNERIENPSLFRVLDPSVDSRMSFEVRQPLLRYFWGRPDVARRRQARARTNTFLNQVRQRENEVAAQAARAYFQLYFSQEQVKIKEGGVADATRLVKKYKEKKGYGLSEESDLLQAEASLQTQKTEVLIAQSQLEQAQISLLAALQRLREKKEASHLVPLTKPMEMTSLSTSAVLQGSRRGDVFAARAQREAAEWSLRTQILDTFPDLSVNASYGWGGLDSHSSDSWRNLGTKDHPVRTAGVSLLVPFGFREERLLRKQSRFRLHAAQAEEQRVEQKSFREIKDAAESLRLAHERVEASQRLVELEKRKFKAEERNAQRGRSSTDLLVRFQQDLRRAESEFLRAQTDEAISLINLGVATGRLLELLELQNRL